MNKISAIATVLVFPAALVVSSLPSALAFMEEGENLVLFKNGARDFNAFTRCLAAGDLAQAQTTGCNPWRDTDANFSYRRNSDQEKSSVHFNMTRALAAAAGFDSCAAYGLAIFTQAADVADPILDQLFWAPVPAALLPLTDGCRALLENAGLTPSSGIDGDGYSISPDFTYRGHSDEDSLEVQRESSTFHFAYASDHSLTCTEDGIPDPATHQNVVPLEELYRWATTPASAEFPTTPLNQCVYASGGNAGPITNYGPDESIQPDSLGAFGIYLHPFQDSISHHPITDGGIYTHTFGSDTRELGGFVSNHLAGEFGTNDAGALASGETITVTTSAGSWPVTLHSRDTADTVEATFEEMLNWLSIHPEFRASAPLCSASEIAALAIDFAGIPNRVPTRTRPSGARARSDLADALYQNLVTAQSCSW